MATTTLLCHIRFTRELANVLFALALAACKDSSHSHVSATPAPKTAEEIWTTVSPSLVCVTAQGLDGSESQGSGFITELEGKRLVLTNRHVVKGAEKVFAGTSPRNLFPAKSYQIASELDLAIVECPAGLDGPPLKLAEGALRPGAEVVALGFPLGLDKIITRGVVGGVENDYFLFDAPISSGNSGGPVVNKFGEVIGMATFGSNNRGIGVIQNLNVGIRINAIPKLPLFQDPVLRLSEISNRIREIEAFIETGYRQNDFFGLLHLLALTWVDQNFPSAKAASAKAKVAWARAEAVQQKLNEQPGDVRGAAKSYVQFLKKCEAKVNALPAIFAGVGNDPVLGEFLKDDRQAGWIRVNATPELLPELARIGADHWLARIEDHRFRMEWALRYSDGVPMAPALSELEPLKANLPTDERPSIRIPLEMSGDRAADLAVYLSTLRDWNARADVRRDNLESFGEDGWSKIDPVKGETLRGVFLGQISDFREHLAIATAEKGNLDEAITLLRADIADRSPACWSGALLAKFLAFSGKFKEAWEAYERHFSAPKAFDAYRLAERSRLGLHVDFQEAVEGFDVLGLRIHGFGNQPAALRNAAKWNDQVEVVGGKRFKELGVPQDVLSGQWYQDLDRLSQMRVLYYLRFVRQRDNAASESEKSGSLPTLNYEKNRNDFEDALDAAPNARKLWEDISEADELFF